MTTEVPRTPAPIKTFNRFELKYLLHYKQAETLLGLIQGHVRRDEHAGPHGYKILSLYYDSPDLACYWEKVDGEKYRRKVRLRTYGDRPDQAFLEIKQRYNLNVQKRRLIGSMAEVKEQVDRIMGLAPRHLPLEDRTYQPGVDPVYDEVYILTKRYNLEPKLTVSYNRQAYVDKYHRNLRITFDRNLRCRNLDLDLTSQRNRGRYALPPQFQVLEVKFNEAMPRWLCTCLNSLDLEIRRISKYCYGIEAFGMQRHTR